MHGHLSVVTYNEICNMAYQGAKVIHPRAVEIAMQAKVPIRVRSTYSDVIGTLVTSKVIQSSMEAMLRTTCYRNCPCVQCHSN